MKGRDMFKFPITYVLATLVRALTGVNFNPFIHKFDLILFIKDFGIWTVSYILVSFIVDKVSKGKVNS